MAASVTAGPKQAARRILERHPRLLKGNRAFHEIERRRAHRDFELRPELSDRPDLLEALVRDGIVVVEDFVPAADVAPMLDEAETVLERVGAGELPEHSHTVQPHILMRVSEVDELAPATQAFFSDPVIEGVMRARMAPRVISHRRELEHRFGVSEVAQADLYHFDNWRPIFKAFLYLDDVTEENAPFRYLAGTHLPGDWRRRHELDFDTYGTTGPFGHFFPQEMRHLINLYGWKETVCTGRAGTLILADFRGLHRGTPLRTGRRVLLNATFDLMNSP